MIKISLCMIVKDEEDVLDRCLKSIENLVDEIIIVDTGSTDKTKLIASKFTKKIYDYKWCDDFSAARNFSFSKANCEYCMWLDADDIFLEKDRKLFLEIKENINPTVNCINMKYNTGFDSNENVTFSYYRERIIKNNMGMHWVGAVHEVISTFGESEYSECAVSHKKLHPSDPDRNLNIFEKLIKNGQNLDPRQQFYYGRELYYHKKYLDAIRVFDEFLNEDKGWLENKIDACRHLSYCFYGLNDEHNALISLFKSFAYDLPRAEVCCEIGTHFFDRDQYFLAIFWYERAFVCERNDNAGGFITSDSYGYTPAIQMCVCYSRLGDIKKSIEFNEKAAIYKPSSEAVLKNRIYFKSL